MKNIFVLVFVLNWFFSYSQLVTPENFNSKVVNKLLLKEINNFRKKRGLDTLVFSKTLYDSLSYPNCIEVVKSGEFYHPNIEKKWKQGTIKRMIANESYKLFKDTVITYDNNNPWITYYENGFRASLSMVSTYSELVKLAIDSWELSPEHKKTQNAVFKSKGLPSFFSCHAEYSKDGYVYIFINYTLVHREL